jgi:hypothetical protein
VEKIENNITPLTIIEVICAYYFQSWNHASWRGNHESEGIKKKVAKA